MFIYPSWTLPHVPTTGIIATLTLRVDGTGMTPGYLGSGIGQLKLTERRRLAHPADRRECPRTVCKAVGVVYLTFDLNLCCTSAGVRFEALG